MWVALSWAHNYDLWKKNPLHRWKWKTRISEIPRGRKKEHKKHASLRTKKKGYICISLHLREKMLKFTYVLRSIYYKCTIQTKLHDMRSSTLYTGYIFMYICCFFYIFVHVRKSRDLITPAWAGTYGLCKRRNICCKLHFSLFLVFSFQRAPPFYTQQRFKKKKSNRCTKITCTVKTTWKENYNLANDLKHD